MCRASGVFPVYSGLANSLSVAYVTRRQPLLTVA